MLLPFFTIITATHNAASTLPRLLDSLAEQSCRDFELVIQDGASSDDTLAVLDHYKERLPSLAVASEPDCGIYDAWNKALNVSQGEWVLFLGADDALAGAMVLQQVKARLESASRQILFACGTVHYLDPEGSVRSILCPQIAGGREILGTGRMPVGHTALFHRRSLFDRLRFDLSFCIAGDYDFLCRAWKDDSVTLDVDLPVTRMGAGGISDSPFSVFRTRREVFWAMRRHFPGRITFRDHIVPLIKGGGLHLLCVCFGKKLAPIVLDHLRVMRGLSPVWTKKVKR